MAEVVEAKHTERIEATPQLKNDVDAAFAALKGRNEMITKTLGAWNRALGSASANSEAEELKSRIEALEKLLQEAVAATAFVAGPDLKRARGDI